MLRKIQLTFADMELSMNRKASRITSKLSTINDIVDWDKVLELVQVVDRTSKEKGGCPHKDLLVKVKMLFLQHLYNLSDPELEDQVNDRLSFQNFVGLDMSETVPDYTTIWRFRDRLSSEGVGEKLFLLVNLAFPRPPFQRRCWGKAIFVGQFIFGCQRPFRKKGYYR